METPKHCSRPVRLSFPCRWHSPAPAQHLSNSALFSWSNASEKHPTSETGLVSSAYYSPGAGGPQTAERTQLVKSSDPHNSMICRYLQQAKTCDSQSTTQIQWVIHVLSCIFQNLPCGRHGTGSPGQQYCCKLLHTQGSVLTLKTIMSRCKRKPTLPSQIWKIIRCLTLNKLYPGDIKLKIHVNIQWV